MSTPHALSLGVGVALRVIINAFCTRNDKLAGALSGIWDGIVAYAAYRTDKILEPLVLTEIIAGVCFDALYHHTPARLASLALGSVLGVLISDTAALHTLWDDLGQNVNKKLRALDIKDDLDSLDVLSEFTDDVTIIYENYSPSVRNRKMTTAQWIEAQRKARSSKSTSRRASASMNISTDLDKSLLLSGFETQTQITTQTQSTRGRRDQELLATMTPLPPPSVSRFTDINIDVEAPSSLSRLSSPTVRSTAKVEDISFRGTNEDVVIDISKESSYKNDASSDHTARAKSPSVKPRTSSVDDRVRTPSLSHRTRTPEAQYVPPLINLEYPETPVSRKSEIVHQEVYRAATDQDSSVPTPFIPPRPVSAVPSSRGSHIHTTSQRQPSVAPTQSPSQATDDPLTFLPFTSHDGMRSRMTRSRASTRRTILTELIAEELADTSVPGTPDRQSTMRSRSSMHHTSPPEAGRAFTASAVRSEESASRHSERPASPAPEVVIDYSGETTRIYIPPPTETGINVRIIRAEDDELQPQDETSNAGHISEGRRSQIITESSAHDRGRRFPSQSLGSFPELESVPPYEHSGGEARRPRSRTSHAELNSDPQPPSIFKLKKAWRDSADPAPPSSSTDYGGRIIPSDEPLLVFPPEHLEPPASDFRGGRSRSNSASSRRPSLNKSHSRATSRSNIDYDIIRLDVQDNDDVAPGHAEVTKTPSVEWFRRSHRSHSREHEIPSEDPHETPIAVARSKASHQSSVAPSSTPDESMQSRRSKSGRYSRAMLVQQRAHDMEEQCKKLREQWREAHQHDRHALAFALKCQLEPIEEQARRLRSKAERLFNSALATDKVDVHRLKVFEAIRATDEALLALQQRGGSRLTVITGRGRHPTGGNSVVKNAIIDRMKKHHFDVKLDDTNPGLLHIYLPT